MYKYEYKYKYKYECTCKHVHKHKLRVSITRSAYIYTHNGRYAPLCFLPASAPRRRAAASALSLCIQLIHFTLILVRLLMPHAHAYGAALSLARRLCVWQKAGSPPRLCIADSDLSTYILVLRLMSHARMRRYAGACAAPPCVAGSPVSLCIVDSLDLYQCKASRLDSAEVEAEA